MSEREESFAQNQFLNYVKDNKIPIKFYLVENIQMKGKIKSFDWYAVVIENEETGNDNLLFKHAIIAMIPSGKLSIEYTEPKAKIKRSNE